MQKKMEGGVQLPQSSVTRIGRKVLFSGEIDEDSYGELIKILFEIENEDEEIGCQISAETALNGIAGILESETEELNQDETEKIQQVVNTYKKNIKTFNTQEREPIHLYINSFGGSIYDVFGIIDIIRNLQTPIYTYCFGKSMSAGLMLFMVGDRRFISQNSTLMLHQITGGCIGKCQDMVENIEETTRVQELVEDLIMLHTHIDEKFLDKLKYRKFDCYIDAEYAVELGIADEII